MNEGRFLANMKQRALITEVRQNIAEYNALRRQFEAIRRKQEEAMAVPGLRTAPVMGEK